jgi:hypothetical protein
MLPMPATGKVGAFSIDTQQDVYQQPDVQAGVYRGRRDFANDQSVELVLPDQKVLTLAVADILG